MLIILPVIILGILAGLQTAATSGYRGFKLANRLVARQAQSKEGIRARWAIGYAKCPFCPLLYPLIRILLFALLANVLIPLVWFYSRDQGLPHLVPGKEFILSVWMAFWIPFGLSFLLSILWNLRAGFGILLGFFRTFLRRMALIAPSDLKLEVFKHAAMQLPLVISRRKLAWVMAPYLTSEEYDLLYLALADREGGLMVQELSKAWNTLQTKYEQEAWTNKELKSALNRFIIEENQVRRYLAQLPSTHSSFMDALQHLELLMARFAPLHAHSSTLYCRLCLLRPQKKEFGPWQWYECPQCQEWAHILTDVQRVRGTIGKGTPPSAEGELQLELWHPKAESTLPAQIDVLSISDGPDIELALAQFLTKIDNHPLFKSQKFELEIADGLVFDPNLMRQLEQHSRKTVQKRTA